VTPAQILATVQTVAAALTEIFRWLQTPQGQQVVEQSLKDRQKWDEFWAQIAKGTQKLFTGELFRAPEES